MSKKMLNVKHHLCSGCCMWSGIEDVYVTKTGEDVPNGFFFCMASSAETVYLKMNQQQNARMFSIGDGRTRYTYDHLKDIIGLSYHISGGASYEYAFRSVIKEIDNGNPVILGPLDMYELPYLKMYHKDHIPMHYVLMIGYDDEAKCIFIYDCDREKVQTLTYEQLKLAWTIEKNVVGNKNGFIRFSLRDDCPDVKEIMEQSMKRKAKQQLEQKPYMAGVSAYEKIAKEFPKWRTEMSDQVYQTTLKHLPEYWGTVPKLPNRLLGIEDKEDGISYCGGYDRFGACLILVGQRFNRADWVTAGELFKQGGTFIEKITQSIVAYLCDGIDELDQIPSLFLETGRIVEQAYRTLAVNV